MFVVSKMTLLNSLLSKNLYIRIGVTSKCLVFCIIEEDNENNCADCVSFKAVLQVVAAARLRSLHLWRFALLAKQKNWMILPSA